MKLYKYFEEEEGIVRNDVVKVGDTIWIRNESIRVITIIKVDFYEKSVYFYGVSENDLNN